MPLRTCISCRRVCDKKALVRLGSSAGALKVDLKGVLAGRGIYVCPDEKCVRAAYGKKEIFSRWLKQAVTVMPAEAFLEEVLKHKKAVDKT